MRLLSLVLCLTTAGCARSTSPKGPTDVDTEAPCLPSYTSSGDYGAFDLRGWPVHFRLELLETQPQVGCRVYQLLSSDLDKVIEVLPAERTRSLQGVNIWVELEHPEFPGAVYHPSEVWLRDNGHPTEWAKGVQIANSAHYLDWTSTQPAMVLHELSHAWHHQGIGYDNATVRNAYDQAMAAGLYDNVKHVNGSTGEAYAKNNVQEYFAELTEAHLWTNDFYPFDRADLIDHDPVGADAVKTAWSD